jgi:hypothetical protein
MNAEELRAEIKKLIREDGEDAALAIVRLVLANAWVADRMSAR